MPMSSNFCIKCLMPIKGSEQVCGNCIEHCSSILDMPAKEKDLRRLTEQYAGKGDKYDIIVPFTGGIDSTYTLYYLAKKNNARVLAYTLNTGMIKADAWKNMKNITNALGVEHEIAEWNVDKFKKLYRSTFKRYGRICYCSIYLILKIVPDALIKNVPLIFTSFSASQRNFYRDFKLPSQKAYYKKIVEFYRWWSLFFEMALDEFELESSKEIQKHILGPFQDMLDSKQDDRPYPIIVPFSNYVVYPSRKDLEALLEKVADWKKSDGLLYHSACVHGKVNAYIEHQRKMMDRAVEIANLIRNNIISKEEGFREVNKYRFRENIPQDSFFAFRQFLEITEAEFDRFGLHERIPPVFLREWIANFKKGILATLPWVRGCEKI